MTDAETSHWACAPHIPFTATVEPVLALVLRRSPPFELCRIFWDFKIEGEVLNTVVGCADDIGQKTRHVSAGVDDVTDEEELELLVLVLGYSCADDHGLDEGLDVTHRRSRLVGNQVFL